MIAPKKNTHLGDEKLLETKDVMDLLDIMEQEASILAVRLKEQVGLIKVQVHREKMDELVRRIIDEE